MKRITYLVLTLLLGVYSVAASAGTLRVAAASDLQFAMTEMAASFERNNPEIHIETVSGSSGKFYQQIVNGAPFDLYFSADIEYPRKLKENGLAASEVKSYAFGRLVLWSAKLPVSTGLTALTGNNFNKVAIANPQHAPYGKAAKASLTYYGLLEKVNPKLVFGENVSQAAQFAQTGTAEGAIIALSLMSAPSMKGKGTYFLIDERSHPPIEQGYVVLKRAEANADAVKFSSYITSIEARGIFIKYGFYLPGEQ